MLSEKQLEEIREHLEKAQNPVIYYDNDADGLCSFVLLRRFLGRGYGVAIRGDFDASYARKAQELGADYVFVLDKPAIERGFFEEIQGMSLPLVWIDHHDVVESQIAKEFDNVEVYNCTQGEKKTDEPVSYWAYKIAGRKEDVWISVMGCISDYQVPDFIEEFKERYGDFWKEEVSDPGEAYFGTEIGRVARSLNYGLKDSVSHVVALQKYLVNCKGPGDVLAEVPGNKAFREKYKEIVKKKDALVKKAGEIVEDKLIFFAYGGDMSMSADLSNELKYLYPGKCVAVGRKNGGMVNMSLRFKGIRSIFDKIKGEIEGIKGGGHEDAIGARVRVEDLEKFKELLLKEL